MVEGVVCRDCASRQYSTGKIFDLGTSDLAGQLVIGAWIEIAHRYQYLAIVTP
jgi:hypothetical protein